MNPFTYILNPVVFFALLVILSAIFILTAKSVFSQDRKAEETLKKAISDKDTLEKELKSAQEEIARLNSELSLKTQMFEGLKGQYNELEKDYEKLAQKAQESAKDEPSAQNIPQQQALQAIKPDMQKAEPDPKA